MVKGEEKRKKGLTPEFTCEELPTQTANNKLFKNTPLTALAQKWLCAEGKSSFGIIPE